MAKLFFRENEDEICYDIESHKDFMRINNLDELTLFEAKRETGTGMFFCKYHCEVGSVNEGCGKFCDRYMPNNGKNGRCKHYGYVYVKTDNKKILKLKS